MKIALCLDPGEKTTNIGIAKALTESTLSAYDLREIAQYLTVYVENNPTEKGGAE